MIPLVQRQHVPLLVLTLITLIMVLVSLLLDYLDQVGYAKRLLGAAGQDQ